MSIVPASKGDSNELLGPCAFCREFSPRALCTSATTSALSSSSSICSSDNDAYYFVADYHALTSVRDAAAASRLHLRRVRHDAVAGPRSREGDSVRSVGRAGNDRAGLAALDRDADGLAREVRQLQGQDRAGAARRARALRLPGAAGGRHLALRRRLGAGRARTRSSTSRSPATSPSGSTASIGGGKDVFRLPKPHILESVAVVPGLDGRKMSKSYNNTIDIFDDPATIRKKVKKIVTDSTPVEAPKNPDTCPLIQPVQALRRAR